MSLIITADLGHLRAFRIKPSDDPARSNMVVGEIDIPPLEHTPQSIGELATDQAGRFSSDGSPGMSYGEAHGLQRETERRLISQLAERIDKIVSAEKAERWKLAAPKAINARLVESLAPAHRNSLADNRTENLAKMAPNDVGKRFGVIG